MKCLTCSHKWKRTKIVEYVTGLGTCPQCGSRLIFRNDFSVSVVRSLGRLWPFD